MALFFHSSIFVLFLRLKISLKGIQHVRCIVYIRVLQQNWLNTERPARTHASHASTTCLYKYVDFRRDTDKNCTIVGHLSFQSLLPVIPATAKYRKKKVMSVTMIDKVKVLRNDLRDALKYERTLVHILLTNINCK